MSKPRRHVFMFQPQFAPRVLDGSKTTTIRAPRKRAVKIGDILDLRQWSGRPYASKQVKLRTAECVETSTITIKRSSIIFRKFSVGVELNGDELLDIIAEDDGFESWRLMRAWFEKTHGLPFTGTLYRWKTK